MQEFASVSAPSSNPGALVDRLNEKAAEGWSVVTIVGGGLETTAYLSRDRSAASANADTAAVTVAATGAAAAEPAGWATTPSTAAASTVATTPAASPSTPSTQMAASSVPAQWAADPTGRYELRYWDGIRWTEHVSRAGQQYTDPL